MQLNEAQRRVLVESLERTARENAHRLVSLAAKGGFGPYWAKLHEEAHEAQTLANLFRTADLVTIEHNEDAPTC
jgi:hypothetical protein